MIDNFVFMFPGQGSQTPQMATWLFQNDPSFAGNIRILDALVSNLGGYSILDELFGLQPHTANQIPDIQVSHPAIFMIQYSLARSLIDKGISPVACLGTSLGEFTSAVLSGFLEVEEALATILHQANCFKTIGRDRGGMLAVLESEDRIAPMVSVNGGCEMAGSNFHGHCLVSGFSNALRTLSASLDMQDIVYQAIPVHFGFHSSAIDEARESFIVREHIREQIQPTAITMFSGMNVPVTKALEREYFWNAIRKPIRFRESVTQAFHQFPDAKYLDLGPSCVLSNASKMVFASLGATGCKAVPIMAPFGGGISDLGKRLVEV